MSLGDEIAEKDINIAISTGKLSGRILKNAIDKVLAEMEKKNNILNIPKTEKAKHGRTTLKQLQRQSDGLSNIELKNADLRSLNKIMKEHGIRFAVTKDGKGKHTLFFKGKDVDTLTKAFEKYSRKLLKLGKNTPSIGQTLALALKQSQTLNNNRTVERNRNRGGLER
jgi:predicted DNA-binding protein